VADLDLTPLLGAVADFYDDRSAIDGWPMLAEAAREIRTAAAAAPSVVGEPEHLPVVDLLAEVVPEAASPLDAGGPVLREFLALAGCLPWTQTRAYLRLFPDDFLAAYGYVRLIGPAGVVASDRAYVGIGVWGPGLDYPLHIHPAEETYHVLAGRVDFKGADGAWRDLRPGDSAHNGPGDPHELAFDPDHGPCVLLFAWAGSPEDLAASARLVGQSSEV